MLVPLAQPPWVTGLSLFLLCLAAWALVSSALWVGLGAWLAYPLAIIPILVHFYGYRRARLRLKDRVLCISADKPWELAIYSKHAGLTDSIEVIVRQRWHHFFGLSLGLKLQNRPHNKTQTLIVMVWRQCLSPSAFHAVALEVARRVDGGTRHSKGDAA